MKKWMILTAVASVFALSVIAFAEPGEPRDHNGPRDLRDPQPPPAMRNHSPNAGMMLERILRNPEAVERLGLTEDQVSSLKDLNLRTAKAVIPLRADVELATLELREALSQEAPDEAEVMTAISRVHQTRAELQKAEIRSRLTSREILGSETLKQIQSILRERMQKRSELRDLPERPILPDRPRRPDAATPPVRRPRT